MSCRGSPNVATGKTLGKSISRLSPSAAPSNGFATSRHGKPFPAPCALRFALPPTFSDGQWCLVISARRPRRLGLGIAQKIRQPGHGLRLLAGEEVAVGIHRQRDERVPHNGLDRLGIGAAPHQPGSARMPQAVKVEDFLFVIHGQ